MQYASIIEGDAVTIKQRVVDDLLQKGDPNYADHIEPHALLARYPIKVHLTTNYDDYMTRALELAGKHPVTAICPWYRGAERDADTDLPADYEPTSERPLVYHLHGTVRRPASLVITEQDYVEFLVNLAKDLGADDRRMVPTQVLSALTTQPLLFIGYSLRDWSFRMLFHGLVEAVAPPQRRRHVSVQLAPNPDIGDADVQRRAKDYLTSYFDTFRISVYWGSAREFCAELNDRLEAAR